VTQLQFVNPPKATENEGVRGGVKRWTVHGVRWMVEWAGQRKFGRPSRHLRRLLSKPAVPRTTPKRPPQKIAQYFHLVSKNFNKSTRHLIGIEIIEILQN